MRALLLASLLALGPGCTCNPEPVRPTNVLVILADDLGVDNVGAYGVDPRSAKTPVIDGLAADGVRFANAWSYPECSPTRAALLTGRYGRRNGIGQRIANTRVSRPWEIPDEEELIGELLHRAEPRWTTAATGKWHLTNENTEGWATDPQDKGFDWYSGPISNLDAQGRGSGNYFAWEKTTNGTKVQSTAYVTSDNVDDALGQVRAMPEPWMLYLPFAAPHAPFHRPPPELVPGEVGPDDPSLYRAMVQAMDREIGRLLDGMDPQVRSRTLVFVVGDNGTPRDAVLPPQLPARAKNSLYEGGIRVPLVVSGPGVTRPGSTSQALVHVVDVFPTLAELVGVEPENPIDGVSLWPALSDPSWSGREVLYAEMFSFNGPPPYFRDIRAVRDDRHKLIRTKGDRELLFDLAASGNPLLEGEDLLTGEAGLTEAQRASYERLQQAMNAYERDLTYAY